MKEVKSIFGLLVLIVGTFVMYRLVPVYWGDFKLERLLAEKSVYYTYNKKADDEIIAEIADTAAAEGIPVAPGSFVINRNSSELTITAHYTVNVDLLVYPLELDFETSSHNKNVMK